MPEVLHDVGERLQSVPHPGIDPTHGPGLPCHGAHRRSGRHRARLLGKGRHAKRSTPWSEVIRSSLCQLKFCSHEPDARHPEPSAVILAVDSQIKCVPHHLVKPVNWQFSPDAPPRGSFPNFDIPQISTGVRSAVPDRAGLCPGRTAHFICANPRGQRGRRRTAAPDQPTHCQPDHRQSGSDRGAGSAIGLTRRRLCEHQHAWCG
jgi:hypothetical protein